MKSFSLKKTKTIYNVSLLFMALLFSCNTGSKLRKKHVVGSYSSDKGMSMMLLDNNKCIAFYFGGMQRGSWKIKKNKIYFETFSEPAFGVYGKHTKIYKDTTVIHMGLDEHRGLYINYKNVQEKTMTPIYNKNANCVNSTKALRQLKPVHNIKLSRDTNINFNNVYSESNVMDIINFSIPKKYNDILIVALSDQYTQPVIKFEATFKNNTLFIEDPNGSEEPNAYKRSPLSEADKENKEIKKLSETSIFKQILEFGDEMFPYYEKDIIDEELKKPFTRIKNPVITKEKTKINPNSIYVTDCD